MSFAGIFSWMPSFVIARNTAFTFKGKSVDAKQVGKELDVRYVLEGLGRAHTEAGTGAGVGGWWDVAVPEIGDTEKLRTARQRYNEHASLQRAYGFSCGEGLRPDGPSPPPRPPQTPAPANPARRQTSRSPAPDCLHLRNRQGTRAATP